MKTRDAIKTAFERLIETTDYPAITVSALAREARISRKTFYAHYASVDALLRELVRESLDKLVREIEPEGTVRNAGEWASSFARVLLTALRDNQHINNNVVRCLPSAMLLEIAREPLMEICEREAKLRGMPDIENLDYYFAYFLGGLFSVYEMWSLSETGPDELDRVIELISDAAAYGFDNIVAQMYARMGDSEADES